MAKNEKQSFQIARSETLGRYMIASENISEGEIIFREEPIMLGPNRFSLPICLGCHHSVDGSYFCSLCGFPMCSFECQNKSIHAENECKIFAKKGSKPKKFLDYKAPQPLYQCIFPLRLLMLRNQTDLTKWTKLNYMVHHSGLRRIAAKDDWYINDVNIVQFLRTWCGMEEFDAETIHNVVGYIDVNCFQVKPVGNIEISGLYELGSVPSQDCLPNTHHAFTEDCQIVFRASVPIPKGQKVTMSYAAILTGTYERRDYLRITKYFECICDRCADPTELGTFHSGIKCKECDNGYLLPENSLKNSNWICYIEKNDQRNEQCLNSVPVERILSCLSEVKNDLSTALDDCPILKLENIIAKYAGVILHKNHFLLIPLWRELNRLYNLVLDARIEIPESELQSIPERNDGVIAMLLNVMDKLQPGLTRSRGVLLYQKCVYQFRKAKRQLKTNEITKEMYETEKKSAQEGLKHAEKIFELDKIIGVKSLRKFTISE